ncbi:MAG: TlpA disulfide reductase family protein [Isosphaeraceae bacterium]
MPKPWFRLAALALFVLPVGVIRGDEPASPPPGLPGKSVAEIEAAHDRALVNDLAAYVQANPRADDLDQAYMTLFETVIEHDWFIDNEAIAKRYLADRPEGPVRSLARIVATMSRAQANDYAQALGRFKDLMADLGKTEQEEFAVNFADSLASSATGAGEHGVARQVYQSLVDKYGDGPNLRQKVKDELSRLDRIGTPAPTIEARDINGQTVRLDALRGRWVLLDFWATWCAPCVAELPRLQSVYSAYRDRGLEIVGVSLDETKTAVTDFVKARNVPWRQIHNATADSDLVEAFGVTTIPATFLIDPKGTIVRLELRGPALDRALAQLIGPPVSAKAETPAKTAR